MYVVKEKNLLGTRNRIDRLWDIPIYKNNITKRNFVKPKSQAVMYILTKLTAHATHL